MTKFRAYFTKWRGLTFVEPTEVESEWVIDYLASVAYSLGLCKQTCVPVKPQLKSYYLPVNVYDPTDLILC